MKRVLIPIIVFVAIGVGLITYLMLLGKQSTEYQRDTLLRLIQVNEGGVLRAEYQGVATEVSDRNMSTMEDILLPKALWVKIRVPELNEEDHICLTFYDDSKYYIYQDTEDADCVFIRYRHDKSKLNMCLNIKETKNIQQENTYEWIKEIVSPEGLFGENEVIEISNEP